VVAALRGVDFVLLVTEPTPFGLNDLKLAVGLVREMQLPFAVIINRDGIGNDDTESYCRVEKIPIAARLPDDRRIAEAYSAGKMIFEAVPDCRARFDALRDTIDTVRSKRDS
jgi:MinD superfamily P-loop ATPase